MRHAGGGPGPHVMSRPTPLKKTRNLPKQRFLKICIVFDRFPLLSTGFLVGAVRDARVVGEEPKGSQRVGDQGGAKEGPREPRRGQHEGEGGARGSNGEL